MKFRIFLYKFITILVTVTSFTAFVEYKLSKVENPFTFKKQNLEKNQNEIEVLITGSSHAYWEINPEFFEYKGFNLAYQQQSLYYDYMLINKYINKMKNLKVILITVSYFTLEFKYTEQPWDYYYKRVYDIPTYYDKKYLDPKEISYIALFGTLPTISTSFNLFRNSFIDNILENGFYNKPYIKGEQLTRINQEGVSRQLNRHNLWMDTSYISINVSYIKKIIALSRSEGVIPILMTTPVFHLYSENLTQNKYASMQSTLALICNEENVEYYNYFNDKRFTIEDFYDNDHLNCDGAERFSKIINKEILEHNIVR